MWWSRKQGGPQKGIAVYLNRSELPISQACFLPSVVELGQVVLEKNSFKRKSKQTGNCDGNSSRHLKVQLLIELMFT